MIRFLIGCSLFLSVVLTARADQIVLKNGDRVTGQIVKSDGKKLTVKTEFMGAVQNRAVLAACIEMSRDVMTGAYYKALMTCRKLFDFEQERLSYDPESLPRHAANY